MTTTPLGVDRNVRIYWLMLDVFGKLPVEKATATIMKEQTRVYNLNQHSLRDDVLNDCKENKRRRVPSFRVFRMVS